VCKVYIAASGRRILPHRSGWRARPACAHEIGLRQIIHECVICWTGDGSNMATLAAIFRLTHF
jgi:hypothetical protein